MPITQISPYSENSFLSSTPVKMPYFLSFLPIQPRNTNLVKLRSALPSAVSVSGLQPRHFNLQTRPTSPSSTSHPRISHSRTLQTRRQMPHVRPNVFRVTYPTDNRTSPHGATHCEPWRIITQTYFHLCGSEHFCVLPQTF